MCWRLCFAVFIQRDGMRAKTSPPLHGIYGVVPRRLIPPAVYRGAISCGCTKRHVQRRSTGTMRSNARVTGLEQGDGYKAA